MAGRPLLCHHCATPLWDEGSHPTPQPGTDAADAACPGCGRVFSVVVLRAEPGQPVTSPAELRREQEVGRQLRLQEAREALAGCRFRAYGLSAGWTGLRWINGWSTDDEGLRDIHLVFGNPFDAGDPSTPAWAEVGTSRCWPADSIRMEAAVAARSLAYHAYQDGSDLAPVRQTYLAADPTGHWEPLELNVAGRSVAFRRLTRGEKWWAIGIVEEDVMVELTVRGLSPAQCRLVEITDYEPFLATRPLLG